MKNKAKTIKEEVRNHITWYNGQQFDYPEGFIRNKKTFLIGMPRMRQLRIKAQFRRGTLHIPNIIPVWVNYIT